MYLIPYAGRNWSHDRNLNFLWKDGHVYLMDNHLAAAWCWAKEISVDQKYLIFHIDRHADLFHAHIDAWCRISPPIESLDIKGYLGLQYDVDEISKAPLFNWQNYMSIFVKQRESRLGAFSHLWHGLGVGDKPWFKAFSYEYYDAPGYLGHWLSRNGPWIVNFDIDYFFAHEGDDVFVQMFSDDYIVRIAGELKEANANGHIRCLTVAISPEMCGGWEPAVRVLKTFTSALGINCPEI